MREIEDVLEDLPESLEDDREGVVTPGHQKQVLGLEALKPERCPLVERLPRQDQGAGAGESLPGKRKSIPSSV